MLPDSWLQDEEETISINYTSGTTGQPKGVQYTYRGAYLNALNEVIVAEMGVDSVYLAAADVSLQRRRDVARTGTTSRPLRDPALPWLDVPELA